MLAVVCVYVIEQNKWGKSTQAKKRQNIPENHYGQDCFRFGFAA